MGTIGRPTGNVPSTEPTSRSQLPVSRMGREQGVAPPPPPPHTPHPPAPPPLPFVLLRLIKESVSSESVSPRWAELPSPRRPGWLACNWQAGRGVWPVSRWGQGRRRRAGSCPGGWDARWATAVASPAAARCRGSPPGGAAAHLRDRVKKLLNCFHFSGSFNFLLMFFHYSAIMFKFLFFLFIFHLFEINCTKLNSDLWPLATQMSGTVYLLIHKRPEKTTSGKCGGNEWEDVDGEERRKKRAREKRI